jgi:hypothetical protein
MDVAEDNLLMCCCEGEGRGSEVVSRMADGTLFRRW